jgi:hypothetical protein
LTPASGTDALRTAALATHVLLLAAALWWCLAWSGIACVIGVALVLASLLPAAVALWRLSRRGLQRATVILVLYVGLATIETIVSQRQAWLPVLGLYAALADLALTLLLIRRLAAPQPESRG